MADSKPNRAAGDTLKPAILGIMLNLIRTSPLAGRVDVSEMLSFISNHWGEIFHEGVLDLGPVYGALQKTPKVKPTELAQIFLLLKKREDRLTVKVKLPADVENIPPAEKDALLREVSKLGVQSGVTLAGMKRVVVEDHEQAHAQEGLTDKVREILKKK